MSAAPGCPEPASASAAFAVALDGELTIYRAAELKPVLLDALHGASAPAFDLSGVTEIDTAGVQLLLLAQREAAAAGARLRLVAPSAAVRDALQLLALESLLGTEPAEASV